MAKPRRTKAAKQKAQARRQSEPFSSTTTYQWSARANGSVAHMAPVRPVGLSSTTSGASLAQERLQRALFPYDLRLLYADLRKTVIVTAGIVIGLIALGIRLR